MDFRPQKRIRMTYGAAPASKWGRKHGRFELRDVRAWVESPPATRRPTREQLLERMVARFDAIAEQLEGLRQQSDSMESGMREFRRSLGWSKPG